MESNFCNNAAFQSELLLTLLLGILIPDVLSNRCFVQSVVRYSEIRTILMSEIR